MLKIKQLFKSYQDQAILKNINLTIEAQKVIGLAGPSGSGKSTLLRCIQKLETIDSGAIICHHQTGFMFQDFQLFPHMTVMQNLVYAPRLNSAAGVEERAIEMLAKLSIANKADCYPCQLSGGQKQRVALARSLMMEPAILLCDEPTSGLDIAAITEVVDLLQSVKKMGITMIVASHDLNFLVQIANRIILLKSGGIIVDIEPAATEDPITLLQKFY